MANVTSVDLNSRGQGGCCRATRHANWVEESLTLARLADTPFLYSVGDIRLLMKSSKSWSNELKDRSNKVRDHPV